MKLNQLKFVMALMALGGCSSTPAEPPPPDMPDALYSVGPFRVEAGEDKTLCTFLRSTNEGPVDIASFVTDQEAGGHHVIVYAVDHAIDSGPVLCTQGGEPGWDTLVVSQDAHNEITFPPGVGYQLGAHQQLVIETHLINASAAPRDVSSTVALTYAAPGSVKEHVETYYFGSMNIDIQPNSTASAEGSCAPPVPMTVRTMMGHEHRHGTGVEVSLVPGDGSAPRPVYSSTSWESAPIGTFDPPLQVGMGDKLDVRCTWKNATPDALRYPTEMCFVLGYYWPAPAGFTCVSGGGGPSDQCTCFERGGLDVGVGGGAVKLAVQRAAMVPGAGGPIDTGDGIYCFLYRAQDYTPMGPAAGARPYYFRDAQGITLASTADTAVINFDDVTPGDYAASCLMDTVGGGFVVGLGDVVNSVPAIVHVDQGATALTSVTLDYAIP